MSTPQVIMSMKHIHQRLASFLRFIYLSGITSRKLCTALFRRLVLSLRFLLSRCRILCEKQSRRVSLSSLGLTKPRIDEEFGSTINVDGQSQVSHGLNIHRAWVYAYIQVVAHYWWADHHSSQRRSMLSLSFYYCTARRWLKFKLFTNAGRSLAKSWNAVSKWWSNHTLTP